MNTHTYLIAEAGVNHNGSLDMAKKLVNAAVEARADAVKFQTFKAISLASKHAPKAEYQKITTGLEESQISMLRQLELSDDDHYTLYEYCRKSGIQFLSTPFDCKSLDFLVHHFDLPYIKLPSGEITNAPLLLKAAQTGRKIILSTGMSTLGEIETALGVLAFGYRNSGQAPSREAFLASYCSPEGRSLLQERVVLLHCTSEYPAPLAEVHLRVMDTLATTFALPVGYSDHTMGVAIPIAAVARGAVMLEKHFTLDHTLPGPDHKASLEPGELKEMVEAVRQVEKALGTATKCPSPSEMKNMTVARKSLVAAKKIRQGECFTQDNVCTKRPGSGVSPLEFWALLGKRAAQDYEEDELIKCE